MSIVKINDIVVNKTMNGENINVSIEDTKAVSMNKVPNIFPNILGSKSKITYLNSDTESCGSDVKCGEKTCCNIIEGTINNVSITTEGSGATKKIYISFDYSNVVGTSNPKDSTILQPAFVICYTNIYGINYVYEPTDFTTCIIDNSKTTTKIDVTSLFSNHTPIIIKIIDNSSYTLKGVPDKLFVHYQNSLTPSDIQDTSKINNSLYYHSNSPAEGVGTTPDPNKTFYYLVEPDTDDKTKALSLNTALYFTKSISTYNNYGNVIFLSMSASKWGFFPQPLHNDSLVVNYRGTNRETDRNIVTNIMMGGYFRLSSDKYMNSNNVHPYMSNITITPNLFHIISTLPTFINEPHIEFGTGTSVPFSDNDMIDIKYANSINAESQDVFFNLLFVILTTTNSIAYSKHTITIGSVKKGTLTTSVKYNEISDVSSPYSYIACNINFIKVTFKFSIFDGDNIPLLFNYQAGIGKPAYQSLNFGLKFRLVFNASSNKYGNWKLQENKFPNNSDGTPSNGTFVDGDGKEIVDKSNYWDDLVISEPTYNAITPVNNIITTSTDVNGASNTYTGTNWGTTDILIEQVGEFDELLK